MTAEFLAWLGLWLSLLILLGCGGKKPAGEREAGLSLAELQQRLQSADAEERLGAVQGLRHHRSEAAPAVPELTKILLKDDDLRVCQSAALTLGEIGPAAAPAVNALISILLNSTNDALRHQAAVALGKIGPDAKAALPVLRSLAQNSPQIVKAAAKEVIPRIQGSPAKK